MGRLDVSVGELAVFGAVSEVTKCGIVADLG
jgi:hypothetical protein